MPLPSITSPVSMMMMKVCCSTTHYTSAHAHGYQRVLPLLFAARALRTARRRRARREAARAYDAGGEARAVGRFCSGSAGVPAGAAKGFGRVDAAQRRSGADESAPALDRGRITSEDSSAPGIRRDPRLSNDFSDSARDRVIVGSAARRNVGAG